jgi:hypothetical protein
MSTQNSRLYSQHAADLRKVARELQYQEVEGHMHKHLVHCINELAGKIEAEAAVLSKQAYHLREVEIIRQMGVLADEWGNMPYCRAEYDDDMAKCYRHVSVSVKKTCAMLDKKGR